MPTYRTALVLTGSAGAPFFTQQYWQTDDDAGYQAALNAAVLFWTDLASGGLLLGIHGDFDPIVDRFNDVTLAQEPSGSASTSTAINGNVTGGLLAEGLNGCLFLNTGQFPTGRQVRGRIYMPSAPEVANDANGRPDDNYKTNLTSAVTAALARTGPRLMVRSEANANFFPVVGGQASPHWARLRSRI